MTTKQKLKSKERKVRAELKKVIAKKKPAVKKRMLVKEKKELMDQLIVCEAEAEKISVAQSRLWERGEKLDEKRAGLCSKLAGGIKLNKEKIRTPILYKSKYFKLDSHWKHGSYFEYSVHIQTVKKL